MPDNQKDPQTKKEKVFCVLTIVIPIRSNPRAKILTAVGNNDNEMLTTTRSVAVSSVQKIIKDLELKPKFKDGSNIFQARFELF